MLSSVLQGTETTLTMGDFFAELRNRHVYRVAAAYVLVAWILLQLYNNLQPILKLPEWVGTLVLVVLVAGFPVSLLFAWAYQVTPNTGEWLSQRSAKAPPLFQPRSTRGISIAVLPLANLSGDAAQEFFSDGMTDEITSALSKVPDLRVVGRSSAFQFKGQYKDLRAIGRALSARYLIEGSVRKAGDRVRITTQLAEAESGTQRWSETYDRELKDVFAVQEDIAQAIAAALHLPLGLKQGESLVPSRTAHLDSYQDYLRAKALVRARGPRESGGPLMEATKLLEQVVARDSNYAPAWAVLAQAYSLIPAFSPALITGSVAEYRQKIAESLGKAEAAAQRAIRLDPTNAEGYTALATVHTFRRQFIPAEDLFKKALSLDPGNPEALQIYSVALATAGRLKDSLPLRQRLRALEPFVPVYNVFTAQILWLNGQDDAAIAMLKALPPNTAFAATSLAEIHAAAGRYTEAAEALMMTPPGFYRPGIAETAADLLHAAPAHAASPLSLPKLGQLSFVFLYVGAPERALEPAEDGDPDAPTAMLLWHPAAAAARKTERFKALVRKAGMVEFWRARGWPDLVRPIGADDFVCD
jgi:adenylate cyclase